MVLTERQISAYLRGLKSTEEFKAQEALEDRLFAALSSKMLTLDTSEASKVALEYARIRGGMEAIKQLKSARDNEVAKASKEAVERR
jgi:hypothetical protein